ncbi:MAG: TonB-dependent receptor plug domain-containing protein [Bacteroidales bacterium]|nr:TonB-dependent receptor plug domain-containing protein [Bacteroidales bacterium]
MARALTIMALGLSCISAAAQATDSIARQRTDSLSSTQNVLREVVITAEEGGGLTAASKIGQDAIQHIQPSSIADLLELIPGGSAKDPEFGSAQTIRLREADPVSSYNTSSLGTQFMVDGVPINNDANLQASPVSSTLGTSFTSSGVDMRSVATDNIQSVEIVRGIPSVEYGDLTSGLVKIERKRGGSNLDLRFKADMNSKLMSVGKGLEWQGDMGDNFTLNADLSYLDSRTDPRNTRQNYQRLTGSLRLSRRWANVGNFSLVGGLNLDYTGSFDDEKSDADLNDGTNGPIEKYKSTYSRFAGALDFKLRNQEDGFFRRLDLTMSLTAEQDKIEQWKVVELGMDSPVCTAQAPGEWDATIVPYTYEATLSVEGKPIYAYSNLMAHFSQEVGNAVLGFKAGANWNHSKNRGNGTVFDLERPYSVDMNVRPRVFKDIPALNQLHFFVENNTTATVGQTKLGLMAGVRAMSLVGLDKAYSLSSKWHFDPRVNLRIDLPTIAIGERDLKIALVGGAGWHTKLPTAEQLYPDPLYYDITQLNYWPSDPNLRRVNMAVFQTDVTNYALRAARNLKWEASLEAQCGGFSMAVTVFREDMKSGFRSSSTPVRYIYKNYDSSGIDASTLGGLPPELSSIPFEMDTLLTTHSYTTNGSRTIKSGVEFTMQSPRIPGIMTRISVTGAYFRTQYRNSQPEYYRPSVSIGGKAFPYIGYYASTDNYLRERFNTNFSTDTQMPTFGLIFSTSFQCEWFTGSQSKYRDPNPLQYIDKELTWHDFTDASAQDGVLKQLIRSYNQMAYVYTRVPFQMNVNLKVSKRLYQNRISLALFANKLIDVSPSYTTPLGVKVRREVNPYFGMELNLRL